jgi:hypothetical protein
MQAVARQVGESELVATLFPLSVDGLAVVASIALVEANRRAAAPSVSAPVDGPTAQLYDQANADLAPRVPASPGSGPLFAPPVVGASTPVLNGSGSNNHQTT